MTWFYSAYQRKKLRNKFDNITTDINNGKKWLADDMNHYMQQ